MKSSGDDEETQIIPPSPPESGQGDKGKIPLPPRNEEETQVISPVEETRTMPSGQIPDDGAPTRLSIKPVGRGQDLEETRVISPESGQGGKGKIPLPPRNEEETQVISPVEETRTMPSGQIPDDGAPTRLSMKPVGRGQDLEETRVISPESAADQETPAETTMYLSPVGEEGEGYGKSETRATPEDFGYVDYDGDDDAGTGTYDFSEAFPATAQAPFTPPPSVPSSQIYGQDAYEAPKKKKKKGKKGKGGWIALIVVLAVLICLGFGGWWWWSTNRRQRALETCQQIQTQLNNASSNAKQVIATARAELDSMVYSQSAGNLVSALQSDVDTTLPVAVSCPASASAALLSSNAQAMNQAVNQINTLISKTNTDIQALKSSQAEAALSKAKSSLSQAIASGKQALAQNNGQVADPAVITALQKALSQAESVEQDTSSTASQMASAQTSLQEAIEKVTASAQQYEQQKLQKLKAQAQQSESASSPAQAPKSTSAPSSQSSSHASTPDAGSGADSYNQTMAGPDKGNLEGSNSGSSSASSSSQPNQASAKKQ